ncbi:hypothetical protein CASFOL_006885 [Castilleja foliolosa]|uniref:Uncharacterized protein n=1 Tax=Castilleja foliolosa TaxID=1961234 RepID=A0ABD3E9P6_9LAMI
MANPSETPQKPGRVAMAVALELWAAIRSITQRHTERRLSPESARLLRLVIATQQGDPWIGSGDPYITKLEQAEISAVTVEQSSSEAAAEGGNNRRIAAATQTAKAVAR